MAGMLRRATQRVNGPAGQRHGQLRFAEYPLHQPTPRLRHRVPREQPHHGVDQLVQLRRRIGPKPAAPRHDARHHGPEELVELALGRDRAVAGRQDGGRQAGEAVTIVPIVARSSEVRR
jgi:hypothetical protein